MFNNHLTGYSGSNCFRVMLEGTSYRLPNRLRTMARKDSEFSYAVLKLREQKYAKDRVSCQDTPICKHIAAVTSGRSMLTATHSIPDVKCEESWACP